MAQDFPTKLKPLPTAFVGVYITQHPYPRCHSLYIHDEMDTAPGVEGNKTALQFWCLPPELTKSKRQCGRGARGCIRGWVVTTTLHSLTHANMDPARGIEENKAALQFWRLTPVLKKSKQQCRRGVRGCRQIVELTPSRHFLTHAKIDAVPGVEEQIPAM